MRCGGGVESLDGLREAWTSRACLTRVKTPTFCSLNMLATNENSVSSNSPVILIGRNKKLQQGVHNWRQNSSRELRCLFLSTHGPVVNRVMAVSDTDAGGNSPSDLNATTDLITNVRACVRAAPTSEALLLDSKTSVLMATRLSDAAVNEY
jgi:hypothetical protein